MLGETTDDLLTYDEAAELLALTPKSLRQMLYWKRLTSEPFPGYKRRKGIRRSEIQRYADARARVRGGGRVILADEAEMHAYARLLASLMAFGLSTDGPAGASMRRETREQVSIMARSTRGRELLAYAWAILAEMEADGIAGSLSAAERARLDFFRGLIRSALAPYADQDAIAEDAERESESESNANAQTVPHAHASAPAADQPHPSMRPATRERERMRETTARTGATVAG